MSNIGSAVIGSATIGPAGSNLKPSLDDIENKCNATRSLHKSMARAKPFIRLWANPQDDVVNDGLVLRGVVRNPISGSFPFTKRDVATGVLRLPYDNHLAKWLISIPNDPEAKKNVVITVEHMGNNNRWSGLLHDWKVERDTRGSLILEATFLDDRQYLKYLLAPPNPALPIPIFQFPRVLPIFGPSRWAIGFLILINLMRVQSSWYTLPLDPFRWESWANLFDATTWQVHVKAPPLLFDNSLWTLLAVRMDNIEDAIKDALDDARLVITYRRILTVDGETPADYGMGHLSSMRNGALILSVEDVSGFYNSDGNVFGGQNMFAGFTRSVIQFASGYVESTLTTLGDDQSIVPDAYYGQHFWGQVPGHPWIVLRDSKYSQIETSTLGWNPAGPVGAIVGGDNPYADQIAELLIQSVGNILGYFALAGFSSAGDIAATVILPFIVGCILAWDTYINRSRASQLGWAHLFEIGQQGGEQNAWSLAALASIRALMEATSSKTSHQFTLTGVGPIYPGLHFSYGDRLGSTAEQIVPGVIFVDEVEVMLLEFDYSGNGEDQGHRYKITVGKNEAGMTMQERSTRLLNKALSNLSRLGVRLTT